MNCLELEYARKRKSKTKEEQAVAIGKSVMSYAKKERCDVSFNGEEKVVVAMELDLAMQQVNDIFLTGTYHTGKREYRPE